MKVTETTIIAAISFTLGTKGIIKIIIKKIIEKNTASMKFRSGIPRIVPNLIILSVITLTLDIPFPFKH